MTGSTSLPYCGLIGCYVAMDSHGSIVQESVGFTTKEEYREWVGVVRCKFPHANFALFAIERTRLIETGQPVY